MRFRYLPYILLSVLLTGCIHSRKVQDVEVQHIAINSSKPIPSRKVVIKPAAERTHKYFHNLKGEKSIAVVANQTSMIKNTHLVDSMLNAGINIVKVFTPEHGFRGSADAGALIDDETDVKTGLPIISLYGNHKKPTADDLKEIDVVVIDLQDVGARFYTYISTMTLVMEACAEQGIPMLILDRPNPNGFYVDGPILETRHKSFIGMHSVPVVHGMTMAEYAYMVNEEGWLENAVKCDLDWIECSGYNHHSFYNLPVKPSPNLPDMNSVILYPSLCFFEGTRVSVGRGTEMPFSVIGYPDYANKSFSYTPVSRTGAMNPPYKDQLCFGKDYRDSVPSLKENPGLRLQWLIDMYQADSSKSTFFTSFFTKLAGTETLRKQIEAGMDEFSIKQTWEAELLTFKEIRSKYLLYKDF